MVIAEINRRIGTIESMHLMKRILDYTPRDRQLSQLPPSPALPFRFPLLRPFNACHIPLTQRQSPTLEPPHNRRINRPPPHPPLFLSPLPHLLQHNPIFLRLPPPLLLPTLLLRNNSFPMRKRHFLLR